MSQDKASATLQKQFETLQEQQAHKLARRKQRAEERGKTFVAPTSGHSTGRNQMSSAASTAFGVDDDLGLKLTPAPASSQQSYSENQQNSKEQIRELKDETGRLYKLLSERDLEIRQYKKKNEQQKQLLESAGNGTNEAAALKIVDLSKKVRELTAEVESEKTKCKQWARKCMDLENEKERGDSGSSGKRQGNLSSRNDRGDTKRDWEAEFKALQQKLSQSEQRCAEQRNQIQQAKQELKMAQKALANEVGEGVSVQSLLNTPSGWRGRSQQILALQKKVTELKNQLQASNMSTADSVLEDDMESTVMGSTTSRRRTANDAHREQIKQMDRERKENQERMGKELRALEQDFESTKTKLDASKARNKVLSGEIKSVKAQMATLLEKGKHDDELISALMKQQGQLKTMINETGSNDAAEKAEWEKKLKDAEVKAQQHSNQITQLQTIINEKEAKLRGYEEEVQNLRLSNLQRAQAEGVNALFERVASRASSVASNRPPTGGHREETLEISSPTPSPSRQSDRPSSTHSDRPSSRKQSAKDHPTNSSGDPGVPQISAMELQELHAQIQQYKSLCQAAEVERDRLGELVKVLEKRVSHFTQQAADAHQEVQAQKRRSVILEKQLGKAKVEQASTGRTSGKKSSRMRGSTATLHDLIEDEATSAANLDELQTRLEIQEDENAALKAALQSTLKAKEEDLQLYQEIMDQTKAVFLQGLRQFRAQ